MKGRLWSNFFFIDKRVAHRVGRSEGGLEQNLFILPTFLYIFISPFWLDTSIFFYPYSFFSSFILPEHIMITFSPLFFFYYSFHIRDCTLHSLSFFIFSSLFISTDMHRGA